MNQVRGTRASTFVSSLRGGGFSVTPITDGHFIEDHIFDENGINIRVRVTDKRTGVTFEVPAGEVEKAYNKFAIHYSLSGNYVGFSIVDPNGNLVQPEDDFWNFVVDVGSISYLPPGCTVIMDEPKWDGYRKQPVVQIDNQLYLQRV